MATSNTIQQPSAQSADEGEDSDAASLSAYLSIIPQYVDVSEIPCFKKVKVALMFLTQYYAAIDNQATGRTILSAIFLSLEQHTCI